MKTLICGFLEEVYSEREFVEMSASNELLNTPIEILKELLNPKEIHKWFHDYFIDEFSDYIDDG